MPVFSPAVRADAPHTTSLLREFVQEGSRTAFTEIVSQHSGLVFAVAQRITGDRSLAEEVAQNVFAVLARKAPALLRLPQLAGWLHQTAVFEAKKRLRSETRHRRKLTALTADMITFGAPETECAWEEILPHVDECIQRLRPEEQRAIRMRYLEECSYVDIAAALGKSEEAGKKQTARAMERLCLLLRKRGVVSAAAMGSALHAGTRTAFSAIPAGPLASAALAAAPSLSRTALFVHALYTMNQTRTTLTAAALLALCAVPVLWQESAIARTRKELAGAQAKREEAEKTSVKSVSPLPSPVAPVATAVLPVEGPLTIEVVADIAEKIRMGLDPNSEAGRRYEQLQKADTAELHRLFTEAAKLADVKRKECTQLFLLTQLGIKDPGSAVREAAALCPLLSDGGWEPPEGIESVLAGIYTGWLKKDYRAALQSFETLRDAGAFHGRGIHQTGESVADIVTSALYAHSR